MPSDSESLPYDARSRLAAIIESSGDAIIAKDLGGIVTSWNEAAETMFGYAAGEVVGHPIYSIVPPDRMAEEAAMLKRAAAGEHIAAFETLRQRKDGSIIPALVTFSPIRDANGHVVGISTITRNRVAKKRIEQELERREALLASILETVPDALIVTDECGAIQSFGAMAERLFGFRREEVIGRNVAALLPAYYEKVQPDYVTRYLAAAKHGALGSRILLTARRKDGSSVPVELTIGEVKLPGAHFFTGFVHDISEQTHHEVQLAELRAELAHIGRLSELGQMVSALAHEVTQPLAALVNYRNAVRRLLADGNVVGAQAVIERMSEQGERARHIVQSLHDLVRRGEAKKKPEDLARAIAEVSSIALIGVARGIELRVHVAKDATRAVIDKVPIQQVLLNLMRNAAEAMMDSPRRQLTVATTRKGDRIEVAVADTGPGLPEGVRARLFEPFVTTKPNGLGIGLSVSRTIIEAHGGELCAEDIPGGGTVFRFTLPAA